MRKWVKIISGSVVLFSFLPVCHSDKPNTTNEITAGSSTFATGEVILTQYCSNCHNFRQEGIGPKLGDSGDQLTGLWIKQFVLNPQKMISSGDQHANDPFKKYKVMMPTIENLAGDQLNSLVAFLQVMRAHGLDNIGIQG